MYKKLVLLMIVLFLGFGYFSIVRAQKCNPDDIAPVYFGQRGLLVSNLQACLIQLGYNIPAGITGYYGIQTKIAIQKFYSDWYGLWHGNSIGPKGVEELKKKLNISFVSQKQEDTSMVNFQQVLNLLNQGKINEAISLLSKLQQQEKKINEKHIPTTTTFIKAFGGENDDYAISIQQTSDGGYIIGGSTKSFGSGDYDGAIIKINSEGNIEWAKTIGGSKSDDLHVIKETSNGNYILALITESYGAGDFDILVAKINKKGEILWSKILKGPKNDFVSSIQETSDEGYIISGKTISSEREDEDILVVKLDSNGNIAWAKTIGGVNNEAGSSIQQINDGGFILTGGTYSFGAGKIDIIVIRLDSKGNIIWAKTIGSENDEEGWNIKQTLDGGFILVGQTGDFQNNNSDIVLTKLDKYGKIEWSKIIGGLSNDEAYSIQQTKDGNYILTGSTYSFGKGEYDIILINIDKNGNVIWTKTIGQEKNDGIQGMEISLSSDSGYILTGATIISEKSDLDILVAKLDSEGNCEKCKIINPVIPNIQDINFLVNVINPTIRIINLSINNISPSIQNFNPKVTDIVNNNTQQIFIPTYSTTTASIPQIKRQNSVKDKIWSIIDEYLKSPDYKKVMEDVKKMTEALSQPYLEVYNQIEQEIHRTFEIKKEELKQEQEKEKERVIGNWATRGLPPSSPIVQQVLQQLEEKHKREQAALEGEKLDALIKLKLERQQKLSELSQQLLNLRINTQSGIEQAWLIKDINDGEYIIIQRMNGEKWLLEAKTWCNWCWLKEGQMVYLKFGYVESLLINDDGETAEFWTEKEIF